MKLKKKGNEKFNTAKKGYHKPEVDEYITKLESERLAVSAEQKERIFELKNQLTQAENKILAFNKMSGRIGEAISDANSNAEQIEKYSMQKLQFEIEQLKAFHERWQEYYARIMQRYPLDDDLAGVKKFNSQMNRILKTPQKNAEEIRAAFDTDYQSETKRINSQKPAPVKKAASTPVSKAKPASPAAAPTKKKAIKSQGRITVKAYEEELSEENIDKLLNTIIAADSIDDETAQAISAAASKFDPLQKIDDYYNAGEHNGSFSLAEALRPKQSLEDILKDLGVDGEE